MAHVCQTGLYRQRTIVGRSTAFAKCSDGERPISEHYQRTNYHAKLSSDDAACRPICSLEKPIIDHINLRDVCSARQRARWLFT